MASNTIVTKEPVVLEGFQAIMKPSQYGYSLSALFDEKMIQDLEEDRKESLRWAESKLKNPKRATLRPEPWEEVAEGKFKAKFSWNEETLPTIVDTEGTLVTSTSLPIFSGSTVKLAFFQKPYILKDGVTYGTSLKLRGVQIISLASSAGIDSGDMDAEDVANLFGKTKGFKTDDPNVTPIVPSDDSDPDIDF